ncbi:hypothetical protein D6817_03485 [Candidatus Pacearchaeota archaeon]|nr:MAG: hypothetical protein D6817_03485 [Candidatus Pacearchaeota archaeon]
MSFIESDKYEKRGASFEARVARTSARLGIEAVLIFAGLGIGSWIGKAKAVRAESDYWLERIAVDVGNAGVQMKYAKTGGLIGLGAAALLEAGYWISRSTNSEHEGNGFY